MKPYLMICEEKKFLLEAETELEAMLIANEHFRAICHPKGIGRWVVKNSDNCTIEWEDF